MKLRRHQAEARLATDLIRVGQIRSKGVTRLIVTRRRYHRGAPWLLTIIDDVR